MFKLLLVSNADIVCVTADSKCNPLYVLKMLTFLSLENAFPLCLMSEITFFIIIMYYF